MPDRGRTWADVRLNGNALVAGTPLEVNILNVSTPADTITVVRILVDLWVLYTANITVTDSLSIVDVGIGVTSAEAFAAGGAALPSPVVVTQFPPRGWLYVASQPVLEKAESAGVISEWTRFQADLRAMRKIDKGVLFMVMHNTNITVGGSMQIVGRVRALCLT